MDLNVMGMTATLKAQFMSTTNKMAIDYQGGTNAIYIGLAKPGTTSSRARWQIRKMTYDANGNITTVTFAGGTLNFRYKWSTRTSYTYQ